MFILLNQEISNSNKNDSDIKISIHEVKNGFGYSLSAHDKLMIKQDYIPALQKKHAFCTFKDAFDVAKLVKNKLLEKQSPTVSMSELESVGVDFKCVDLQ